ncbi:hypothetical protein D3C86_2061430 [compost metagenome]
MTGVAACRSNAVSSVHRPSPDECITPFISSSLASLEKARSTSSISQERMTEPLFHTRATCSKL